MVFSYPAMLKLMVLTLEIQPSSFDPRVVLLVVADRRVDWETGARGGDDYWIAAERLVEKHRAGDFDDFAPGDFSNDDAKELELRKDGAPIPLDPGGPRRHPTGSLPPYIGLANKVGPFRARASTRCRDDSGHRIDGYSPGTGRLETARREVEKILNGVDGTTGINGQRNVEFWLGRRSNSATDSCTTLCLLTSVFIQYSSSVKDIPTNETWVASQSLMGERQEGAGWYHLCSYTISLSCKGREKGRKAQGRTPVRLGFLPYTKFCGEVFSPTASAPDCPARTINHFEPLFKSSIALESIIACGQSLPHFSYKGHPHIQLGEEEWEGRKAQGAHRLHIEAILGDKAEGPRSTRGPAIENIHGNFFFEVASPVFLYVQHSPSVKYIRAEETIPLHAGSAQCRHTPSRHVLLNIWTSCELYYYSSRAFPDIDKIISLIPTAS
ncbi:hypothetical protein C8J57DRAFT_1485453 [Mycena rebaudengoi]|nr:hypothetical protein C8J57DRAFT_1485453 [Mycena rebaudengoi]